ncbi:hypothetical protein V8E52_003155 [Russula decolorans]
MMRDRFCHCRGSCRSRGGLLSPLNSPNVIEWSDRSSPSEYIEATGIKRREYGNAGRVIKLCSNHVEVKLDQGTLYHYDVSKYSTVHPSASTRVLHSSPSQTNIENNGCNSQWG